MCCEFNQNDRCINQLRGTVHYMALGGTVPQLDPATCVSLPSSGGNSDRCVTVVLLPAPSLLSFCIFVFFVKKLLPSLDCFEPYNRHCV